MGDAALLVNVLRQKLQVLDRRVAEYRRQMEAEFERFSNELLEKVPDDVAAEVKRTVAESMQDYPSLISPREHRVGASAAQAGATADAPGASLLPPDMEPADARLPAGCADGDGASSSSSSKQATLSQWHGRRSPPPLLRHTSGAPRDDDDTLEDNGDQQAPRSPHQREKEFQGIFTPQYLPLLDSSGLRSTPRSPPPPQPSSEPTSPASSGPATPEWKGKGAASGWEDEQREGAGGDSEAEGMKTALFRQPPRRRMTDDTMSSAGSVGSDGKVRKSALRQSSKTSTPRLPHSPRRVRFDVQGRQVLPTSSPQEPGLSPSLLPQGASDRSASPAEDDPHSVDGSNLGDLVASLLDSDSPSPPRKVSSSQALRALSREPLDANTTWQVVNPDPADLLPEDDEDGEPDAQQPSSRLMAGHGSVPAEQREPTASADTSLFSTKGTREAGPLGKSLEEITADMAADEPSFSDDENDVLTMPPLKSFRSKGTYSPATVSPVADQRDKFAAHVQLVPAASPSHTTKALVTDKEADDAVGRVSETRRTSGESSKSRRTGGFELEEMEEEEGEEMFHLDDVDQGTPKRHPSKVQDKDLREDDEKDDEDEAGDDGGATSSGQIPFASSPAVRIAQPTIQPPATRFQAGSMGSYKGRSLVMPVIKNPALLEEIEALGDVVSFVGGVDGRSGVDESDLSSYRASTAQFSGTPKSFTERMAFEEAKQQGRHRK